MNSFLLIIGIVALSNGNISFLENKNKTNKKTKSIKRSSEDILFDIEDINRGIKMLSLNEDDLERGMEIINRSKKYVSKEDRSFLIKVESILDLVKGIKKLNNSDNDIYDDTDFFRSMDDTDKKNMMIKEILEVLPDKKKESVDKAIDLKRKIDLFAELFLPDDFGEDGFSLSSLIDLKNIGSMGNLSILGDLLRNEENEEDKDLKKDDEYE